MPSRLIRLALIALLGSPATAGAQAPSSSAPKSAPKAASTSAKPTTHVPLPPPPGATARAPAPDLKVFPPAATTDAPKPKQALRVAMPDVKVRGDLPPRQLALLESALLAEVRKLEGVSAIGMGEIREMLSFEYQRQMLGCQANESCLAEIGGALGTDEMIHAEVIVDGKTANFTLRRINMRTAVVTRSHSKRLTRANGEELLGAVGPAVQELFPDRNLRAGMIRGVDKAVALRLNPPPLPRWPFYVTAGAAVVAASSGAVYAVMSKDATSQYNALLRQSPTAAVPGAQLRDLERSAESRTTNANVLFVTAGTLAAAAGVMALFTDWHGYGAQVEVGGHSGAVKVGGTF
jgi:hypothetical protein